MEIISFWLFRRYGKVLGLINPKGGKGMIFVTNEDRLSVKEEI